MAGSLVKATTESLNSKITILLALGMITKHQCTCVWSSKIEKKNHLRGDEVIEHRKNNTSIKDWLLNHINRTK
jgi:hypothetical protein